MGVDLQGRRDLLRSSAGRRADPGLDPFLNKVATEPPITADPEGREVAVSEQPVDRRPMDPEKVRQLFGGQQFVICHIGYFHFQSGFTLELEGYFERTIERSVRNRSVGLVKLDLGPMRTR